MRIILSADGLKCLKSEELNLIQQPRVVRMKEVPVSPKRRQRRISTLRRCMSCPIATASRRNHSGPESQQQLIMSRSRPDLVFSEQKARDDNQTTMINDIDGVVSEMVRYVGCICGGCCRCCRCHDTIPPPSNVLATWRWIYSPAGNGSCQPDCAYLYPETTSSPCINLPADLTNGPESLGKFGTLACLCYFTPPELPDMPQENIGRMNTGTQGSRALQSSDTGDSLLNSLCAPSDARPFQHNCPYPPPSCPRPSYKSLTDNTLCCCNPSCCEYRPYYCYPYGPYGPCANPICSGSCACRGLKIKCYDICPTCRCRCPVTRLSGPCGLCRCGPCAPLCGTCCGPSGCCPRGCMCYCLPKRTGCGPYGFCGCGSGGCCGCGSCTCTCRCVPNCCYGNCWRRCGCGCGPCRACCDPFFNVCCSPLLRNNCGYPYNYNAMQLLPEMDREPLQSDMDTSQMPLDERYFDTKASQWDDRYINPRAIPFFPCPLNPDQRSSDAADIGKIYDQFRAFEKISMDGKFQPDEMRTYVAQANQQYEQTMADMKRSAQNIKPDQQK